MALDDLRKSLSRIKELSAWLELEKAESKGRRDFFSLRYDPTEFDLKTEIGFFFQISSDVREEVAGAEGREVAQVRQRLAKLEQEFRALGLSIS